jgi:hypothetical protein
MVHPDVPFGVPTPRPTPPGGAELIADKVRLTAPADATLNVTTLEPPTPRVPENEDPAEVDVDVAELEPELESLDVSLSRIPQATVAVEASASTNAVSRCLLRNASFRCAERLCKAGARPDR